MQRLPHVRIVIEPRPQSGDWNMAVDQVLLESAISMNRATLRWYRWDQPTVSLGYFQKFDELAANSLLSTLPRVRRLSGGGAIVHDQELTYCLTLPGSQRLVYQPHELYDVVHGAIAERLRHLGFPVKVRGIDGKRADEPLLCFQRRNTHDVILQERKILGSAQRRRRGAIMQHGSLILRASQMMPGIPGLADLSDVMMPVELARILAISVAEAVADDWSLEPLNDAESATIDSLRQASDH